MAGIYGASKYFTDKMAIGDRIRAIRSSHNLRKSEFAKKIGSTLEEITTAESGVEPLQDNILRIISKEFGISVQWIKTGRLTKGDPKEVENFYSRNIVHTKDFTYSETGIVEILEGIDVDDGHDTFSEDTENFEEEVIQFYRNKDKDCLEFEEMLNEFGVDCYYDGFLCGYRQAVAIIRGMLGLAGIPDAPKKV